MGWTKGVPVLGQIVIFSDLDEPFVYPGDDEPARLDRLRRAISRKGFRWSKGRLHHFTGDNDKGKAVEVLKRLYRRKFGSIVTVAPGDTALDFPMLRNVDHPVLVRGRDGGYAQCADIPRLCRVDGLWSGGVEQGHSGFH